MSTRSLESREMDSLLSEAPFILHKTKTYSRLQLVSAAYRASQILPDARDILNLYTLRHEFIVILMAIAFKKSVAVLPANTAKNTLLSLIDESEYALICSSEKLSNELEPYKVTVDITKLIEQPVLDKSFLHSALQILSESEIKIYTSGSTGTPKPVLKNWVSMVKMASKAIERFDLNHQYTIVSTVPGQHMFGLETSVFWPLFSNSSLWSDKPLFSEDMKEVFQRVNNDVFLVSTPLHLKNWVESQQSWQAMKDGKVLSATAPMYLELAKRITSQWQVKLFEVLGSTETASFASREIMVSKLWKTYKNTTLQLSDDGYKVLFSELDEAYPLQDNIQEEADGFFKLLGRRTDVVKVAGKRTSMEELNQVLLSLDGILDGIFLNQGKERLSAAVVSNLPVKTIRDKLKEFLDPVFLPRPIYFLDKLPRNELGKLQMDRLLKEIEGKSYG